MNDGGPAFPTTRHHMQNGLEWQEPMEGMSLRDYFAAKALEAMSLKDDGQFSIEAVRNKNDVLHADWVARAAYRYADAMLRARKK